VDSIRAEYSNPRKDGGSTPTSTLQFRKKDWVVADAHLVDAQQLVRQYHYAKGGSNTAVYVHGLWHRATNALYGVAWWLPPTRVVCESVDKENWTKVLSLTRLVILPGVPSNACSFLLAHSVRLMRVDNRFTALVTYADESQGHSGAIYLAANWRYVGRTGPYPRWIDPTSGRQVHPKATKNRTKAQMNALGYVLVGKFHKHKYVLFL